MIDNGVPETDGSIRIVHFLVNKKSVYWGVRILIGICTMYIMTCDWLSQKQVKVSEKIEFSWRLCEYTSLFDFL